MVGEIDFGPIDVFDHFPKIVRERDCLFHTIALKIALDKYTACRKQAPSVDPQAVDPLADFIIFD